jgi:hypothetical protein
MDTTLAADLGVADASTDEVYAAMDWLVGRQDQIERALARRHLQAGGQALFDLSSYVEGRHCELAARGYSRDQKVGKEQIEYGLLTDPQGRPVAVEVVAGNTADPTAFTNVVERIRTRFGLQELVLVGDRGMITAARVGALRELGGMGWITCLRAAQIKTLAEDGALQLSLFDQTNLAEITHPDFPGERLVCCRNPALATQRARKRAELLAATQAELDKITRLVEGGKLKGAAKIGVRIGRVLGKYRVAKHFDLTITDSSFAYQRRHDQIAAEAALDGIYLIRTSVTTDQWTPPAWSRPTSNQPTSNATSAASRASTWSCGRSGTGWPTGSAPTRWCACWPATLPGTSAAPWPRCASPTPSHPHQPTRSPPPSVHRPPTARPPAAGSQTAAQRTASAPCWTTLAP